MVSYEALGRNVARLISIEAARLGAAEEKLEEIRGKNEKIPEIVNTLAEQLHYLGRVEAYLNGKMLQIIGELRHLQGVLTAKKVNFHTAYKHFKIQDRTTANKEVQREVEEQMKQLGNSIRQIDMLIEYIKQTRKSVVSDVKRDMSTLRVIAEKAE